MESPENSSRWKQLQAFRQRHAKAQAVAFFSLGFGLDVFTLRRIDNTLTLVKHGVFLVLLTVLLALEQKYEATGARPSRGVGRVLAFSEDIIHFLFGSLLSAFTVLYFKSASGLVSLGFLAGMCALLVANEVPAFRKLGASVRFGLHSFCVTSYLAYLFPVLVGFLSPWLFTAASGIALLTVYAFFRRMYFWRAGDAGWAARRVALPGIAVQGLLMALYLGRITPPVPLSVQFMGIYHGVQRDKDGYVLQHERPDWELWHHGDQNFRARAGDRIYCFVRIFAPTRFKDHVLVRWFFEDPRTGWRPSDAIPMDVSGGRDDGYRGYSFKQNYQPGAWRVAVETDDGREIGEMRFTVAGDQGTEERVFKEDRG
jgi:hypothetical protein